jgi:energy-coupling factor transporter ATP-binding protein EcfA2
MATYFLRPEAGPVPFGKLQRRAKDALKEIVGFLNAAVRSVQISSQSTTVDSRNTTVDTSRASRIFFVSGEPGSGKSTLYLTLKAMLSNNEEEREKFCEGCKDEINLPGQLNNLQGAVHWLDTLDLEVAGDEGENLLAAVLVRIIDALTKSDINILSTPCEEAIKDLEELATDIGIAWGGNLQARAGELDPDTYSEEVMRTQRARLRINERLREALEKIAKSECYGFRKKSIFVLPVDDFYLKPDASLQLLRLLRMISVPRLFFLVMGDITTIEALFVEKSLKDWTAVAGPEIFATLPQRQDEALARARELRARYLRKLLPPGQRVVIEAMDWHEALDFKPERLNGKETTPDISKGNADIIRVETLKNFLEKRNLDPATDTSSLLTFLISPPYDKETNDGDVRSAREAYTALQILDATSREIMDLWFGLHELDESKNSRKNGDAPPLLSLVIDFVKLVIEEQNFLNEEQQGLLFAVLPTRHYTEQEIYLDMNRLRLQPEPNTWKPQLGEDQQIEKGNQTEKQLWVRKHRSWRLGVNTDEGESNEDEGLFAKLPPRQTAWMILLHDLAWKWNSERVTGNLVEKLCDQLNKWPSGGSPEVASPPLRTKASPQLKGKKKTEVKHFKFQHLVDLITIWKDRDLEAHQEVIPPDDLKGWAVWYDGSIYKHFPMPDFKTFQELDRFLFIWSRSLDELWKNNNVEVNNLLDLWHLSFQTILLDGYKDFAINVSDWYKQSGQQFIEGKRSSMVSSSPPDGDRDGIQKRLNDWTTKITNFKNENMKDSPPSPT